MARARLGDEEDWPDTSGFQSREWGSRRDPGDRLGIGQSRRRQAAEIAAAAAVDTRHSALGVDMHDQIPADRIQPVRDQAEAEVSAAATVLADPAQAQVARRNSKRRDDLRQDGAKRRPDCGRIVHPINIDVCQIPDDMSRQTVGRAVNHERVGQRRERSAHVAEPVRLGHTLLGRLAAGAER